MLGKLWEGVMGVFSPRMDEAALKRKLGELHAGLRDQRRHRGPGGHHDLLARIEPCLGNADERDGMRCVVRADDEEGHDAIEWRALIETRR